MMPPSAPANVLKKQRRYYSGKKKRHTQKAQVIADKRTGKIIATAFCEGKKQDFALFKASRTVFLSAKACLADLGYQGLMKLHSKGRTPRKKSKQHPLTEEEKTSNRAIARERIGCEHVMGRLKVFKILSLPYRN
ncbi:MAG: transposase [Chthonomonadaceae bacterium]|nr:transposase [Chthonomonadaceae bacterium]